MSSSLLRFRIPDSLPDLIANNLTVNGSFSYTYIRVQHVIVCHCLFLGVCYVIDSF